MMRAKLSVFLPVLVVGGCHCDFRTSVFLDSNETKLSEVPAPIDSRKMGVRESVEIRGVLSATEDGEPLRRVEIQWVSDRQPALAAVAALRTSARTQTDDAGRFVLPRIQDSGVSSLWARLNGNWSLLTWTVADKPFEGNSVFWPRKVDHQLRLRINLGEQPIEGKTASVRFLLGGDGGPLDFFQPTRSKVGEEFRFLVPATAWFVDVASPGFATKRAAPNLIKDGDTDPEDPLQVTLLPACVVSCQVVTSKRAASSPTEFVYKRMDGVEEFHILPSPDGIFRVAVPQGISNIMSVRRDGGTWTHAKFRSEVGEVEAKLRIEILAPPHIPR